MSLRFDGDIGDYLVVNAGRGLLDGSRRVILLLVMHCLRLRRAFEGSDGVVDDGRPDDDSADDAYYLSELVFPAHYRSANIIISSEGE